MNLASVRAGLATAVGTISGLRTSAYAVEAIMPPIFVVGEPSVDFDQAMHRGLDQVDITCRVYVSKANLRTAQDALDAYLIGSGAASVKAAIETDRTLGGVCSTLRVLSISNYGTYGVGEADYLGATVTVRVWGQG